MDILLACALFIVALVASFIDVIAGGSSLIVIPALAALGIPLVSAIATNRLYVVAFILTGLINYLHKKVPLNLKVVGLFAVVKVAGAIVGSYYVLSIDAQSLKALVATLMLCAIAAVFIIRSRKADKSKPTMATYAIAAIAILAVGFYEGAVGGGGGTITRVAFILLLGFTMLEASLADAVMTLAASGISAAIFIANGAVDYSLLLPMLAGGIIGAYAGSHMAVKNGSGWAQKFLYAVSILLIAKLLLFP